MSAERPQPRLVPQRRLGGVTFGHDSIGVPAGEFPFNPKSSRELVSFAQKPDTNTKAIVDLIGHLANTGEMNLELDKASKPEQNATGGVVTQIPIESGEVYHIYTNPVVGGEGEKGNIVRDTKKR